MKLKKEEHENLINNSPLFGTDKVRDRSLYDRRRNEFLNQLLVYCINYVYPSRKLEEISLAFMETADECIRYYDKEKGNFLTLFLPVFKRNAGIAKAKDMENEYRKGIRLTEDESILISKITRLAKSRGADITDPAVQEKIAKALHMKPEEVASLIRINADAVGVRSLVKNEDGDEVELFDLTPSGEMSAEQKAAEESQLKSQLDRIERGFDSLQNRPNQRRIISMLLTAKYIEEFDGERQFLALLEGRSFYSKETENFYMEENRVPLDREIAEMCGVSPEQASNTFANFEKKFK